MSAHAVRQLTAGVAAALPIAAFAHHPEAADAAGAWRLVLAALLVACAIVYATGVKKLWRKAGMGRGIRAIDVARFGSAWLVLVIALAPPVDDLADRSFAVHMVQHELLMVVAAPLFVLSRTREAFAWALPAYVTGAVAKPVFNAWTALTAPLVAWTVHALALWLWHVPALFVAALEEPSLHVLQHACFFVSALMFWWAVFRSRTPDMTSVACLFTTMLHTSALAVLLTLAPAPWYARAAAIPFGLTALEDQQLGGLIMWVPGAFAYVVAGLAIATGWLSQSRARTFRSV